MPEIDNINEILEVRTNFKCPKCKKRMDVVGLMRRLFWCHECQQAYKLAMIKKNDIKKSDLKNVIGFTGE